MPARESSPRISSSLAPSKTGVAKRRPSALPAQPRWVSRIWPTFMRLGTPSGLRTISTGGAVLEERHVLVGEDHRDHALVAVAPGHLVADLELALHGDVDLDLLDDAGRQLVAGREQLDALVVELLEHLDLRLGLVDQHADPLAHGRSPSSGSASSSARVSSATDSALSVPPFLASTSPLRAETTSPVTLAPSSSSASFLLRSSRMMRRSSSEFLRIRPISSCSIAWARDVLLGAAAGEDLDVHHHAGDPRRALQRRVAHVAGLLAEDGAQQLLLGGELGLALGRHLADQDAARAARGRRCGRCRPRRGP